MKKTSILMVVCLSIVAIFSGCNGDTKKNITINPVANYSQNAIHKESSEIISDDTSTTNIESQLNSESNNHKVEDSSSSYSANTSVEDSAETNLYAGNISIDYDALTDAIAEKVADRIAEKIATEQIKTSDSVSSDYNTTVPVETSSDIYPEWQNDESVLPELSQESETSYTQVAKYSDGGGYEYQLPELEQQSLEQHTESTVQTPDKQDNTLAIAKIQQQITVCENDIQSYELEIERLNGVIEKCKLEQENLRNNELAQAKIDLENSKKRKVWVYGEARGFQQTQNKGAVKDAQENVDFYEGLISDYDDTIATAENSIAKCNLEISTLKSQIVIYQAEIEELS